MSGIIRLLPDSVANQIAAGEVVQRPGSAVKELLENAVDSGATEIRLIIKEAGKTLIQVTDNGCGMSEQDARLCFERHATSKISTADDLLRIRTLGFRGEALASIASIAQVELRTKRIEDEIGTSVIIEGTEVKSQTPVSCPDGTSVSVKNLFFNVPARRNFLKSNTLELKYIMEEFFRVALVYHNISFTFFNNDKILFQFGPTNLKQRLVNLFGVAYNQRLIPVGQETALVRISGYIGKPEYAKKTRGEQYFFTNGRYIRTPYLHHAIETAFQSLIPSDAFPTYFIYLEMDPGMIDVNIHPTKTEINFQDIKTIYAILHAAVKQSIGKFNLSPTLDFEPEPSMDIPPLPPGKVVQPPTIHVDPDYNPFEKKTRPQTEMSFPAGIQNDPGSWNKLYEDLHKITLDSPPGSDRAPAGPIPGLEHTAENEPAEQVRILQVSNGYLVTSTRKGIIIIDRQRALERILFERLTEKRKDAGQASQKLLLPEQIQLSPQDAELMATFLPDLEKSGFGIREFGPRTFIIDSVPAGCPDKDLAGLFEMTFEALKNETGSPDTAGIRLAKAMARNLAVNKTIKLAAEEAEALVEQLFTCQVPDASPDGKPTMLLIGFDDLSKKFKTT